MQHALIISRMPLNPQRQLLTLAIDHTDSSFYGTTNTELFRIDRLSGAVSLVGGATGHVVDRGLTFDRDGNLFGIGTNGSTFVMIDKLTGMSSLISNPPACALEDIAVTA